MGRVPLKNVGTQKGPQAMFMMKQASTYSEWLTTHGSVILIPHPPTPNGGPCYLNVEV